MNVTKPKNDEAFIIIKKKKTKLKSYFYLTSKSNLNEAAKNLYSCLRNIKNEGYKSIAVEKIPNVGIGKAINDRLKKASKY
jgi:L-threonylcarbamoyladenylate synthase